MQRHEADALASRRQRVEAEVTAVPAAATADGEPGPTARLASPTV